MKKLLIIFFLIALIYLTSYILRDEINNYIQKATVILFSNQTELKKIAIEHYNNNEGVITIEADADLEIISRRINTDKEKDFIVIYKTEQTCGGGGCIANVFLKNGSTYEPIDFEYAIKDIQVAPTITNDMHDIIINGVNLTWNGEKYIKTQN